MRQRRIPFTALCALLLAAAATPIATAQADDATKPIDQEQVVRLEVSPAAPPDPALRYTLLAPIADQVPGPAAPLYFNAFFLLPDNVIFEKKETNFHDLLNDLSAKPLADLKNPEIIELLNRPSAASLLWQASLRTRADWGTTIREQGFEALLPYLSRVRMASLFLSLHARASLASGDTNAALRDARVLFSLCNHLREEAVIVQALVGAACADQGLSSVIETVIQSPGAPNLYWALANLPSPMFDMRDSMGWERAAVRASIAPLRGRSPEQLSPGEWEQVTRDFVHLFTNLPNPAARPQDQFTVTAFAVLFYPHAKQTLIDRGTPADAVNAMPATQVLGMALLQTYDHWIDETAKWAGVPYWQAAPHLNRTSKDFLDAKAKDPFNPAFAVLPALDRTYASLARLDRHVAAVQTVEAIRAYAAAHDGTLPPSLDQITDTPAPIDPTTGKPFDYHTTGNRTAELASPPLPNQPKSTGLRYVVTLRK